MKLQRKHKQLIALLIGVAIVVFGILQVLFRFNIDMEYINKATLVLFVIALGLLFSGRHEKEDPKDKKGENDVEQSDNDN